MKTRSAQKAPTQSPPEEKVEAGLRVTAKMLSEAKAHERRQPKDAYDNDSDNKDE